MIPGPLKDKRARSDQNSLSVTFLRGLWRGMQRRGRVEMKQARNEGERSCLWSLSSQRNVGQGP